MKNVIVIFMILVLTGALPVSCCLDSCGCGGAPKQKRFRIISMEASATNQDRGEIDRQTFYRFDEVAVWLSPVELEYTFLDFPACGSLISGAVACDPALPEAAHNVRSITVVANAETIYANENEPILSGQDISELFLIGNSYSNTGQTIPEFLDAPPPLGTEGLKLLIATGPVVDTELVFQITIEFDDNKVFSLEEQLKIYAVN